MIGMLLWLVLASPQLPSDEVAPIKEVNDDAGLIVRDGWVYEVRYEGEWPNVNATIYSVGRHWAAEGE